MLHDKISNADKQELAGLFEQMDQTTNLQADKRGELLSKLLQKIDDLKARYPETTELQGVALENSARIEFSLNDKAMSGMLRVMSDEPRDADNWLYVMRDLRRYLLNEARIGAQEEMGWIPVGHSDGFDERVGFSRHKSWDQTPEDMDGRFLEHQYGEMQKAGNDVSDVLQGNNPDVYRTGNAHGTGSTEGRGGPAGQPEFHPPKSGLAPTQGTDASTSGV